MKQCHQQPPSAAVDEVEEDALSLCDLPIHSSASESEKFSSSVSSVSSSDSEFFEFFSEEWNKPSSSNLPPEKIIFCGKLISRKGSAPAAESQKQGNTKQKTKSRTRQRKCYSTMAEEESSTSKAVVELRESSEPPPPVWKSRWFLFLFGMAGVPKEMDLKDMKNRQSRKTASSSAPEGGGGGGGNRLWWMIKALSCSGGGGSQVHAQAIVKASIGCIAGM